MTKHQCYKKHFYDLEPVSMAEKLVLFHGTRFRIALSVHEYVCPHCGVRDFYFIGR